MTDAIDILLARIAELESALRGLLATEEYAADAQIIFASRGEGERAAAAAKRRDARTRAWEVLNREVPPCGESSGRSSSPGPPCSSS